MEIERQTFLKSYRGSTGFIESWLEATLCQSLNTTVSNNHDSAIAHLKFDRKELARLGLNKAAQDRLYRSCFVYANGMSEIIKEFEPIGENFSMRIWDIFMRLLDYSDPNHTESYTRYLRDRNLEDIDHMKDATRSEMEKLRQLNEQLTFDLANAQLRLMDIEYKLEIEVLFNKTFQNRQEFKLNSLRGVLESQQAVVQRTEELYGVSRKDVEKLNAVVARLCTSEVVAVNRAADLTATVHELEQSVSESRKAVASLTTQLARITEERDRSKVKIAELQTARHDLSAQNKILTADVKLCTTQIADLTERFEQSELCVAILGETLDTALTALKQFEQHAESCAEKHAILTRFCNVSGDSSPNVKRRELLTGQQDTPPASITSYNDTPTGNTDDGESFQGGGASDSNSSTCSSPVLYRIPVGLPLSILRPDTVGRAPRADDPPTAFARSFDIDAFQQSLMSVRQFVNRLDSRLRRDHIESAFMLRFDDMMFYLQHLSRQLDEVAQRDRIISELRTAVQSSQFVAGIYPPALSRYHDQAEVLKATVVEQSGTVAERDKEIERLTEHVQQLQEVVGKYDVLEPRFMELVDEYRALATRHADTQCRLSAAEETISLLRTTETAHGKAVGTIARLTRQLADSEAHVQFLLAEKKRLDSLVEQHGAASTSSFRVFDPLLDELTLLEARVIMGIDAYGRNQKVTVGHRADDGPGGGSTGDAGSVDACSSALSAAARIYNSSKLEASSGEPIYVRGEKAAPVSATTALALLLQEMKYTDSAKSGVPAEQQQLVVRSVETVLSMQRRIGELFARCDSLVDVQLDVLRLQSELAHMRSYCSRERRRIIKYYDDQINKAKAAASAGLVDGVFVGSVAAEVVPFSEEEDGEGSGQ